MRYRLRFLLHRFGLGAPELWLLTAHSLWPIWWYDYLPATDLPQHLGVAAILFRLLQADAAVTQFYAFNLQPVPYYLLYLLLTPAVGWLGPLLASKMLLSAILLAIVGGMARCGQALGQPSWWAATGILLFYSSIFFWGFTTTLVGVPLVIWQVWALLRLGQNQQRRYGWLAGALGAVACSAHGILLLTSGAAVLGYWSMAWRRHWRQSVAIGCLCLLPMVPCIVLWCWQAAGDSTGSSSGALYHWETPRTAWDHIRLHFASFDRSWGRSSHQLLLVLALGTMRFGVFPGRASERRLLTVFVLTNLLLFVLVPLEMKTSQGLWAWLLNVRYLLFVEFGLLLLAGRMLAPVGQHIVRGATALLLLVFLGHLHQYVYRFQAHAAPLQDITKCIEPNKTMMVYKSQEVERFLQAWPPVLNNMSSYLLAHGLAYANEGFAGGHLPIRIHASPAWQAEQQGASGTSSNGYDYVLLQGPVEIPSLLQLQGMQLRAAHGMWRLYERVATKEPMS